MVVLLGLAATVWASTMVGPLGLLTPVPLLFLVLAAGKVWDILRHQAAVRVMLESLANDTPGQAIPTSDIPVTDGSAPSTSGGDTTDGRSPYAGHQTRAI
jgi:hypothetical protein